MFHWNFLECSMCGPQYGPDARRTWVAKGPFPSYPSGNRLGSCYIFSALCFYLHNLSSTYCKPRLSKAPSVSPFMCPDLSLCAHPCDVLDMLGAVLRVFHATSLLQPARQVQFVFTLQKRKTDRDRLMIFLKVTKLPRVRARTQVHSQLDSLPVLPFAGPRLR